jgi:hypothetical protein
MQGERQVSVTPQLALGVFIMAAGVLLTLDRLELVEIGGTLRLWPGIRGASPLGLPYTLSRSPLRRLAPFAWLIRWRSFAS